MSRLIKVTFLTTIVIVLALVGWKFFYKTKILSPIGQGSPDQKTKLLQYTYTALRKTKFSGSDIIIDKILKQGEGFVSYLFYYQTRGKKVSGLLNVPSKAGNYPLIIMFRGYVDPKNYFTGDGTVHGGELLAQNGFITVAPDFLGYGFSDPGSSDPMEDRFLTYVTALELMHSVNNLNSALSKKSISARFDGKNIGVWGHSNGGQIALSVMEISGENYPTVLWAPVSKPFPYSILFYTDEADDQGKSLIKLVADFEKDYNAEDYSLTNYFDWIKAPLEIHQGTADIEVPQFWSDELVDILKKKGKSVEYYTYSGEDHNFDRGSWPTIMERTMDFYKKHF